ncbi:hypothetical protein GJAV_G00270020 [Gymnothorax javanicus]|nr:hypothetical protein GJAV_G00270020 [Gymnothorax javanicus]
MRCAASLEDNSDDDDITEGCGRVCVRSSEEAKSTTWLHPVTGEAVSTGHRKTPDLPAGWEEGFTFEGARCFINHNEQKVTCKHPVSGQPSQETCIFILNEQPVPTAASNERKDRPLSIMTDTSTYTSSSDFNPHLGSPPSRPSRSSKKVHNFGKRSNSIKRNPNAPVVRSGWLYKQDSTGMKLWKKRWFVLSDMCLFYYRDEREECILGSILLPSFRISMLSVEDRISKKYAFKATHPNMRTYYFATDMARDMEGWMKAMTDAALVHTEPIKRQKLEQCVPQEKNSTVCLRVSSKLGGHSTDGAPQAGDQSVLGQNQMDGEREKPRPKIRGTRLQPDQAAAIIAAMVSCSQQDGGVSLLAPGVEKTPQLNGSGNCVPPEGDGVLAPPLSHAAPCIDPAHSQPPHNDFSQLQPSPDADFVPPQLSPHGTSNQCQPPWKDIDQSQRILQEGSVQSHLLLHSDSAQYQPVMTIIDQSQPILLEESVQSQLPLHSDFAPYQPVMKVIDQSQPILQEESVQSQLPLQSDTAQYQPFMKVIDQSQHHQEIDFDQSQPIHQGELVQSQQPLQSEFTQDQPPQKVIDQSQPLQQNDFNQSEPNFQGELVQSQPPLQSDSTQDQPLQKEPDQSQHLQQNYSDQPLTILRNDFIQSQPPLQCDSTQSQLPQEVSDQSQHLLQKDFAESQPISQTDSIVSQPVPQSDFAESQPLPQRDFGELQPPPPKESVQSELLPSRELIQSQNSHQTDPCYYQTLPRRESGCSEAIPPPRQYTQSHASRQRDSAHSHTLPQGNSTHSQAPVQRDSSQSQTPVQSDSTQPHAPLRRDSVPSHAPLSTRLHAPPPKDSTHSHAPLQRDSTHSYTSLQRNSTRSHTPIQRDSSHLHAIPLRDSSHCHTPLQRDSTHSHSSVQRDSSHLHALPQRDSAHSHTPLQRDSSHLHSLPQRNSTQSHTPCAHTNAPAERDSTPAPPPPQDSGKALQRTSSMQQLEQWVRMQRGRVQDDDTESVASYLTLPRKMPSQRPVGVPRYPDGYRTLPRNSLVRPDSVCSLTPSLYDRTLGPSASAAEKRRSMRDDTMWQLYEWRLRQTCGKNASTRSSYSTLPNPRSLVRPSDRLTPAIPLSPSHGSLQQCYPSLPSDGLTAVTARVHQGAMTLDRRHRTHVMQYVYPPERRSLFSGAQLQPVTPQSLHGRTTVPEDYRDNSYIYRQGAPDLDVKLSRLCEQDRVVINQEHKLQQLYREKHTLETALLSASQEIEMTAGDPTALQSVIQQRDLLRSGLLSTCRELARVSSSLERSWKEFAQLESDVTLIRNNLLEQLEALGTPQTEPPSLQHVQIQKELWRIQDVTEALSKNRTQRLTDPRGFVSSKTAPSQQTSEAADYRLCQSEPELSTVKEVEEGGTEDRAEPGGEKELSVTKGLPYPVGVVSPRTKPLSPESSSISSYVTLRKSRKPEPKTDRPHSAAEQPGAPGGPAEMGRARMSVEEQMERIRRHQEGTLRGRKKPPATASGTGDNFRTLQSRKKSDGVPSDFQALLASLREKDAGKQSMPEAEKLPEHKKEAEQEPQEEPEQKQEVQKGEEQNEPERVLKPEQREEQKEVEQEQEPVQGGQEQKVKEHEPEAAAEGEGEEREQRDVKESVSEKEEAAEQTKQQDQELPQKEQDEDQEQEGKQEQEAVWDQEVTDKQALVKEEEPLDGQKLTKDQEQEKTVVEDQDLGKASGQQKEPVDKAVMREERNPGDRGMKVGEEQKQEEEPMKEQELEHVEEQERCPVKELGLVKERVRRCEQRIENRRDSAEQEVRKHMGGQELQREQEPKMDLDEDPKNKLDKESAGDQLEEQKNGQMNKRRSEQEQEPPNRTERAEEPQQLHQEHPEKEGEQPDESRPRPQRHLQSKLPEGLTRKVMGSQPVWSGTAYRRRYQ